MNLELLRKTQESIANPDNPFSMLTWDLCICGHMRHIVTGRPLGTPVSFDYLWGTMEGAQNLDIHFEIAAELFQSCYMTRTEAIAALEDLVRLEDLRTQFKRQVNNQELVAEPEPELVCA